MASIGKNFKKDLRTAILAETGITDFINDRYFVVNAGHDPKKPYIVVSTISGQQDHDHEGSTGLEQFRIQFSIFVDRASGGSTTCEDIRDALKDLLDGLKIVWLNVRVGYSFFDNEVDSYSETSDTYQKDIDFQFMVSGL